MTCHACNRFHIGKRLCLRIFHWRIWNNWRPGTFRVWTLSSATMKHTWPIENYFIRCRTLPSATAYSVFPLWRALQALFIAGAILWGNCRCSIISVVVFSLPWSWNRKTSYLKHPIHWNQCNKYDPVNWSSVQWVQVNESKAASQIHRVQGHVSDPMNIVQH